MPIPAWRAKQSTSTSGTGTLTLNAAANAFRSFNAAFGASSIKVLYTISGASYFEHGIGTFNGGSPGTLARDTVLASSNAGALVSLPAGVSDVFATFLPSQAEVVSFSVTSTVQLADLGCIFHFTGTSAATLNLPAIANVPPNSGIIVRNSAALTSAGILTIDPNASELVNGATTLALFPGESVQLYALGGAWFAAGVGTGWRALRQQVASSVAQIDFTLPSGFPSFMLEWDAVRGATDAAALTLRTSVDGGSTFANTSGNYSESSEYTRPGASNVQSLASGTNTSLSLSAGGDTTNTTVVISGSVRFTVGSGTLAPAFRSESGQLEDSIALFSMFRMQGVRSAAAAINAVRLLMTSGNISVGSFTLFGRS